MKLPAIALALLGATASATAEQQLRAGQAASIDANSVHAHRLLSSANTRALENNDEEDTTWMVNYALQFDSCHEIAAVGGEAGGREEGTGSGVQRLVKLKLCPKDTCGGSCRNGAEYLVEMREFLETYMEQKEEMEEQQCEYQQQKCEYSCENQYNNNNNQNNANRMLEDNANNNNYYNEDYCLMNCLSEAGYGDCYEGDDDGNNNGNQAEDLDYARFAECESLYEGNNNNNGNYNGNAQAAYVGAYCSKGGSAINLGVFSDPSCTIKSDNSLFESVYYQSLPYATTSMVGRECLSCDAAEYEWEADDDGNNNNNNGNNGYNYEVAEICEEVHERAAKCEKNLQIDTSASAYNNGGYTRYYPHTESCQLIHSTLSSLESVTKTNGKSLKTARAFAWIFFFTTLGAVGYILYLHKNKEGKIDLSLQGVLGGSDAVESSRIA